MPRIRKQRFGGASAKLAACFDILLSGAPGECLAGELGCCADSCCSSAAVSRALAEYCQHSAAAREAFVAGRGLEAMQAALTRGSPAVAAAAARVLAALCGSTDGLRRLLHWQRTQPGSSDLLAQLAAAAGGGSGGGLPPDLRAECVEALRAALGALHGPAAGGGLELAAALQESLKSSPDSRPPSTSSAASATAAAAAASVAATRAPCDLISRVAVPALLTPNLHLRAAAARLVAAAAEEGLLGPPDGSDGGGDGGGGGARAAAGTLAAALGLTAMRSTCGGRGGGADDVGGGGVQMAALCELASTLLLSGSTQASLILREMRAPQRLLQLAEAVYGRLQPPLEQQMYDREAVAVRRYGSAADVSDSDRNALMDAVLLCVRHGPSRLWRSAVRQDDKRRGPCRRRRIGEQGPEAAGLGSSGGDDGGGCQAENGLAAVQAAALVEMQQGAKAFAAGVAALAVDMLLASSGSRGGNGAYDSLTAAMYGSRMYGTTLRGNAAALASALAEWPQVVLRDPRVSCAATALLKRLCEDVGTALATTDCQRLIMAAGTDAGAERRVVATGAAAAVRLYGALYGKAGEDAGADHAVAGDIGASTGGEEAAHAARPLLQGLLLRLLDAACELIRVRNFSTAAEILRGMLQALLPPSLRPLVLVTSGGNGGGGSCTSGQAAAAAPATAAEKEEEERLGTQFGWNSSSSSGSDGSNFLLLRSLGQVTAALVAGLLVSGGLASTPSTPPALLPRDVRQPLAVHLDEGAEAATEGPMWGEKQQGYYYHDDQQAWGAASGSGMAGTYNDSSSGRSSLQYQGQGQGGSRMHGALRERPVDALATDEHAALCTALRVWGGLMGQRQVCTCRREGGGATATAGVLGHHAEACDACAVRPGGPLLAVMEAAESLLHAEAGLFSGACTDTFCTSSGTPQLSYTSVGMQLDTGPFGAAHAAVMLHGGFECGTGLEQRSIRLLSALRFALTAAIKTNPTTTSTSPTTQESVPRPDRCSLSLDKLERMRCLLQQLDGTGIPDLTRLGCISGDWKEDTPQDVVGDEGLEPAGADVAVREEATTAEELAEAEAILEECLACIRTASSGASLSIPAWE